jgi:DNA-directed RNA polymerase subunit RPC12/RpoP
MELTCPDCGLTFETQATTNTRCRRCRKVVNIGSRRGRSERVTASDDASRQWSARLIGGGLVVGGVGALWHGVKVRQLSTNSPDGPTSLRNTWPLWCTFGVLLIVVGTFVVLRSSSPLAW